LRLTHSEPHHAVIGTGFDESALLGLSMARFTRDDHKYRGRDRGDDRGKASTAGCPRFGKGCDPDASRSLK